MAFKSQIVKVVDISPTTRSEYIGRISVNGVTSPVTFDVEVGFVFKKFMVSTAGNVNVIGVDGLPAIFPACQPGTEYFHFGLMISSTGTTATGIYVMGGV
jgi:hypothetical protein